MVSTGKDSTFTLTVKLLLLLHPVSVLDPTTEYVVLAVGTKACPFCTPFDQV